MKKIAAILLFANLLLSCNNNKNDVTFINDSEYTIDSVFVFGNQKCSPLVFKDVISNKSANGNLKNCNIKNGDGSYGIELYYNNKIAKKGFGYYTNGWMDFDKIEIIIRKDESILINEQ